MQSRYVTPLQRRVETLLEGFEPNFAYSGHRDRRFRQS